MFDVPEDPISIALIEKFAIQKKVVAAVCHGRSSSAIQYLADSFFLPLPAPAVFHNVKVNGESIFKGRKATCFSNEEEEMVKLVDQVPFLVETDSE